MIVYLDTSVLLRVLLGQRPLLAEWGDWERAYTSELAGVEARRVIDRLRLDGALDDDGVVVAQEQLATLEAGIGRINLTRTPFTSQAPCCSRSAVLRAGGVPAISNIIDADNEPTLGLKLGVKQVAAERSALNRAIEWCSELR